MTPKKIKSTGLRYGYSVIQWADDWDPSLTDLMELVPNIVVGCRVAIASCDSGKYRPSATELANGWEVVDGYSFSPKIASVSELPMSGFDEWYVFEDRPVAFAYKAFVNRFGFSPLTAGDPRAEEFWVQVDAIRPLHVLGAGTPVMFVVTRDANLFAQVSKIW